MNGVVGSYTIHIMTVEFVSVSCQMEPIKGTKMGVGSPFSLCHTMDGLRSLKWFHRDAIVLPLRKLCEPKHSYRYHGNGTFILTTNSVIFYRYLIPSAPIECISMFY